MSEHLESYVETKQEYPELTDLHIVDEDEVEALPTVWMGWKVKVYVIKSPLFMVFRTEDKVNMRK